jgi:cobyrinic acid a,c-diamide synthase
MEKTVDVEGLLGIFIRDACEEVLSESGTPDIPVGDSKKKSDVSVGCAGNEGAMPEKVPGQEIVPRHDQTVSSCAFPCRVAVARDEVFCFYYAESLRALREAGAEPVFFSPVHDKSLPDDISGLYLGGGYPELYAGELSENREMLAEIREAVNAKMPLIAECGGFLYLQKYLEDESGTVHEMAGAFSGTGRPTGHLVRFGYLYMTALQDSLLFRKGEVIPAHEFHHWDTDDNGRDLEAVRARGGQPWQCAYVSDSMYAGFPHISLGGEVPLAERFVERMKDFSCSV